MRSPEPSTRHEVEGGVAVDQSQGADAVVIGGGVIGASTAFHLAKAGAGRVLLLERHYLSSGATGKSHSLVRMHYTNPHDAALAHASLPYFHHWGDLVGAGDPRFVKTGVLRFAPAADEAKLRANVAMLQALGINTWVIEPDEIREIDPGIHTADLLAAAWEPDSGYADPVATTWGFAKAAERAGATVRTGVVATAILADRGRVTGVATSQGVVATGAVVVAAGAWGAALLAPLGFDLGLVPQRIQVAVFRRPEPERRPQATIIDGTYNVVIRPEGEADVLVATHFDPEPVDPDQYDESFSARFVADARARLVHRRPAMTEAPLRGGWSGVVAVSPDGHIVLDRAAEPEGLFLAAGCSGTNFKTAPAIGRCLAEWVTEGAPRMVDLHAFRATRFAEGVPVTGEYEYGSGADFWR